MISKTISSCGVIIFYDNETVLVESKKGNCGFPKGGIEKNESYIETALRELEEESGITGNDISFIKDSTNEYEFFDEERVNSFKRYFIAKLNYKKILKINDINEIKLNYYIKVNDAIKLPDNKFSINRKHILEKAYKIYLN